MFTDQKHEKKKLVEISLISPISVLFLLRLHSPLIQEKRQEKNQCKSVQSAQSVFYSFTFKGGAQEFLRVSVLRVTQDLARRAGFHDFAFLHDHDVMAEGFD